MGVVSTARRPIEQWECVSHHFQTPPIRSLRKKETQIPQHDVRCHPRPWRMPPTSLGLEGRGRAPLLPLQTQTPKKDKKRKKNKKKTKKNKEKQNDRKNEENGPRERGMGANPNPKLVTSLERGRVTTLPKPKPPSFLLFFEIYLFF